jgi:voltage-gated potassium channel
MNATRHDRYSLLLLISLIVFLMLSAFVREHHALGEGFLLLSMYVALVACTLELSQRKNWRLPGAILAGMSMTVMLVHFLNPTRMIMAANWFFLAAFLGFVSAALFSYLGLGGSVTSGRLYGLVSLYILLGVFYYSIFNLLETIHPRSFMETAAWASNGVTRHSLLYLSLITLTTLGYGDIVPVTPAARMFAAFEAMTGVLYIAITVARLVSAYQKTDNN